MAVVSNKQYNISTTKTFGDNSCYTGAAVASPWVHTGGQQKTFGSKMVSKSGGGMYDESSYSYMPQGKVVKSGFSSMPTQQYSGQSMMTTQHGQGVVTSTTQHSGGYTSGGYTSGGMAGNVANVYKSSGGNLTTYSSSGMGAMSGGYTASGMMTTQQAGGYTAAGLMSTQQSGYTTTYGGQTQYAVGEWKNREIQARIESGQYFIVGEKTEEKEVMVPCKKVYEDRFERIVVIPLNVRREETEESRVKVKEKIIEVQKKVEPEIEYVDEIIEVPEKVYKEKIKEVTKIELQEKINYIPKVIVKEKLVEEKIVEYREIPREKIVEVPEIEEEIIIKEIPVPQYVEVPTPEIVNVEVREDVHRNVPATIECQTRIEFGLPRIVPVYERQKLIIYAPRFVEIAVPVEQLDDATAAKAAEIASHVSSLSLSAAPSLCEIEKVAEVAKNLPVQLDTNDTEIRESIVYAFKNSVGSIKTQPRKMHAGASAWNEFSVSASNPTMTTSPSAYKSYRTSGGMGEYRTSGGVTSGGLISGGEYRTSGGVISGGEYRTSGGVISGGMGEYRTSAGIPEYRTSAAVGEYRSSAGVGDYRTSAGMPQHRTTSGMQDIYETVKRRVPVSTA